MLSIVKREARHVGCVTLYLLFCFSVFSMLKKLTLATYQIEWSAILPTVIGTLAIAKVVVVLDHIPVASRIDTRYPIWVAALYKTLFYCAATAPVLYAENVWYAYREDETLGEAVRDAWAHMDQMVVFARVIVVGLVFAGYHLYQGIDRRLGQGTLGHMIFSRN